MQLRRNLWLGGVLSAAACLSCCAPGHLGAQDATSKLLLSAQSRLKPVLIVVAPELPLLAGEPAQAKPAVVLRLADEPGQVIPASATEPLAAPPLARVVPASAPPKPTPKSGPEAIKNPFIAPAAR